MGRYLIKSTLEALGTLLGLTLFSFLILKILPGGPFDDESSLHPLIQQKLEQTWGLHESFVRQIFKYLNSMIHLDLGDSLIDAGRPVTDFIHQGFGATFSLNLVAIFCVFAIGLGLSSALMLAEKNWLKEFLEVLVTALISLPSLFLGPLLIYVFCFYWDLLPTTQLQNLQSFILPLLALSLRPAAFLTRLLTNNWREQLGQEYMRLAIAKGLSQNQALFKHALKNSLIPVLNYSGPLILHLISGSFLVEMLFAIPGLGTTFVKALSQRDYPVVMGVTLFLGTISIFIQWIVDFFQHRLDPQWQN